MQLQIRECGAGLQNLDPLEALGDTAFRPHLHSLLANEQPAEGSTVGLIGGHLATQGRVAASSLIAWAGQFLHQIGALRCESTALLGSEGLPAIKGDQRGIGAQNRTIRQKEPT